MLKLLKSLKLQHIKLKLFSQITEHETLNTPATGHRYQQATAYAVKVLIEQQQNLKIWWYICILISYIFI